MAHKLADWPHKHILAIHGCAAADCALKEMRNEAGHERTQRTLASTGSPDHSTNLPL